MVIIVFGLPGSGKSFFAARLATRLQAEYFNTDQLRREMVANRIYSNEEKMAVYDAMLKAIKKTSKNKVNLVLDGTFYKEAIRKKFLNEVGRTETLQFIEVMTDETVIRERLAKPRIVSEADLGVYDKIKGEWEPMKERHLIIHSTNENIDKMLKEAEDYLFRHDK